MLVCVYQVHDKSCYVSILYLADATSNNERIPNWLIDHVSSSLIIEQQKQI